MLNFVLTVTCKSTCGIVAAISGYLAGKGCNIIDSAQFDDLDTGRFFMRVSFISEEGVLLDELCDGFAAVAAPSYSRLAPARSPPNAWGDIAALAACKSRLFTLPVLTYSSTAQAPVRKSHDFRHAITIISANRLTS